MPSIAVVADTDSSLSPEVAAAHGIRLVPITVTFGDESFETGVDIDDRRLFERIDREGKLPTTAAPSPGAFAAAYENAFSEGAEQVLCICVSSTISATYQSALSACDLLPKRTIRVVDSHTLSMVQGFMALEAAQAAQAGTPMDDIVARIQSMGDRGALFGALSTLKYIAMSGRIGHLAAGMATLLAIKPILSVQDGKLEMAERVRSRRKSWARTVELLAQHVGGADVEKVALLHVAAPERAIEFYDLLRKALPACPAEPFITNLSAGLSVHTGAGLVGAAIIRAAR